MRFPVIAFLSFFFTVSLASARDSSEPDTLDNRLSLNIKSMNFFRNNEYFNPIKASDFLLGSELPWYVDKSMWIEGYTLTGFFFRPELVYNVSSKITLRAGGHFLKYWGTDRFSQARPVFSTSVRLSKNTELTLGSLSGSDRHKMYDPHFNRERHYTDYAEDGLQIQTTSDHFFNDAWISWENFIFRGDNEREIFNFGESLRYVTQPLAEFLNFEIPVQIQFKHFGGQISDYNEHVTTFFNFAGGLRANFDFAGRRFGSAGLEYTRFYNKVIPGRETYIIKEGHADWWRAFYNYKILNITAGYWHANDFYAPNGNPLYASVYVFDSDYSIHERKLLTGEARISVLPHGSLELYFGIETFYDIPDKRLDHAATLHLNFEKLFRLYKPNSRNDTNRMPL
ncbi:MAG TPA: hypothetical protein VK155_03100 [Bacteroidales bacterium]|jgi:hypothetical protein|nr:hypothetical protein [Bacteroidales bacterium]